MIIDVPTPNDFERSGKDFLHMGWEQAYGFLQSVKDFADPKASTDIENFTAAAQSQLSKSLALVQQGVEQLLKARIAEVIGPPHRKRLSRGLPLPLRYSYRPRLKNKN